LLSSEADADEGGNLSSASAQGLTEQQNRLDAQRKAIQAEMENTRKLIGSGSKDLEAKLAELQGELDMVNARKNLLDTMWEFVNESDAKRASASALKAHIDAIAVSIPSGSTVAASALAGAGSSTISPGSASSVSASSGSNPRSFAAPVATGGTSDRV